MKYLHVIVASLNPVKQQAVKRAFARMFPSIEFEITPIQSQVILPDQPLSDDETLTGAEIRAEFAQDARQAADLWIGIEGGVQTIGEEMSAFAWVVIRSRTQISRARTGTFFLPPAVALLIQQGKELGEADDIVFGQTNSKQQAGAIGILTGNVVDRTELYEHAVILALAKYLHPELYGAAREESLNSLFTD